MIPVYIIAVMHANNQRVAVDSLCRIGVDAQYNYAILLSCNLLSEVCSDVQIEPDLKPLTGEILNGTTSNSQDGAVHGWISRLIASGVDVTRGHTLMS